MAENRELDALVEDRGSEDAVEEGETEALLDEAESPEEAEQSEEIVFEKQPKENWHRLFEAALFMSPNTLGIPDFMKIVGSEDYTEVKHSMLDFLKKFNSRESSLEILQVDDSFKMQVKAEFEPVVSEFAAKALFHDGMMKTLALIAFKQPIMQSAVIKYRNNKAYDHISHLVEEGFVAREQKGRSFVLRTTKKFLEHFGADAIKQKKL
ncbi:MAG TPA: SMC-Scp complex subunit ScpB [archaeon]|nr:SMC-Scp complex subunit ScpB [archaeon]